jgi:hypothetical protein
VSVAIEELARRSIGPDRILATMKPLYTVHQGRRYRLTFRNASDDIHPLRLHRHCAVVRPTPHGVAGAALGLIGIFLPGMLVLVGTLPFWEALRARAGAQAET